MRWSPEIRNEQRDNEWGGEEGAGKTLTGAAETDEKKDNDSLNYFYATKSFLFSLNEFKTAYQEKLQMANPVLNSLSVLSHILFLPQ